jgi:hypothetical protein
MNEEDGMAEVRVRMAALVMVVVAAAAVAVAVAAPQQDSARRERSTFVWSRDGERIEISHRGAVEFTDDDTDVRSLAPGGHFRVSTGSWFGRGVDIRADGSGVLSRRYRVSIVEKPYEPEGREWLARMLPRFIRESGIGAPARVKRFLERGGPAAVLAEIARIEGGHGKRVYFTELFRVGELDGATARQALVQAVREIRSDYDMASLLVDVQHLATAAVTRAAYFDAASTIQSDYEMRRALSAGLENDRVEPQVLADALEAAASIDSDYELATLLVQVAQLQPLDATTRRPFFAALSGVGGAYERGRVLATLAERSDLSDDVLVAMLQSGARMGSDHEQAQFLSKVAKRYALDGVLRPAFFTAADGIHGSYEKARVLETVARRTGSPADTVVALLRAAATIDGNYERSQVLQAVAAHQHVAGPARDAYLQAAERLGEYEQGKVLAALVRSERRK